MNLQSLAVIFIIIILPISLLLGAYTGGQIQTLRLQIQYDTKLSDATYDALKAFQLNAANSASSDLTNSKLRDINASVNTFFNSIASNFNMSGYGQEQLKEYVPALVYTMYDGYYIYSPFINTLDPNDNFVNDATYKDGEKVSGLKPYIYYSCRYKYNGMDFVINYSLDNYIVIQGTDASGNAIYESGYLLNDVTGNGITATYRGTTIEKEATLQEYIGSNSNPHNLYTYIKINGVKYYKDTDSPWFSLLNGTKLPDPTANYIDTYNDAAVKYYTEAAEFKQKIDALGLRNLTSASAVDENGNSIDGMYGGYKIFNLSKDGKSIEDSYSDFNQHRLAVIRYSIEKNLSIAIANYNYYGPSTKANFQMPELREDEWDKLLNNISIISFMQGLSIGGKIYNGYSIVNNNKNEELVTEESIYIISDDGNYYRPTSTEFTTGGKTAVMGAWNIDFERKGIEELDASTGTYNMVYYYPRTELGDYNSIVTQTGTNSTSEIITYIAGTSNDQLKKAYYTALGRERYSLYRPNKDSEELKQEFTKP